MNEFTLEWARQHEAERRRNMLGAALARECTYDILRERSRITGIPIVILSEWRKSYEASGDDGLYPQSWTELANDVKPIVWERYKLLGELADTEQLTDEQITAHAERVGWTVRQTQRWLLRYRIGGLWGLAPGHDHEKHRRRDREAPPRDLATLDDSALEEIYRRREMLGPLAEKAKATTAEVEARATEVNVSSRTLWNWLRAYRQYGLAGLAPQQRSDKNRSHNISDRMVGIIRGIRLSKLDATYRDVYEQACEKARQLHEPEPSEWQVRAICDRIREAVKLIADGRENEFRSRKRGTIRIHHDGSYILYQVDHTQIDVLVRDIRSPKYRTKSGEVRLWLTAVIDTASRLLVAARFEYDHPNRFTVAAALRDAFLLEDEKTHGGVPNEVRVDRGRELVSRHVEQLCRELGIELHICKPRNPNEKAIVERFFSTLNTRLWAKLGGYVASNVAERNPNATATLTPKELIDRFWTFINEEYNSEKHSETGQTPLEYWVEHCFAEYVDPRLLDLLLKESVTRIVINIGIKYEGRVYWHPELTPLVGEEVLIRAAPSYTGPDEIEVFYEGRWLCTAIAVDTERGRRFARENIATAQRTQRHGIKQEIQDARKSLDEANTEIASAAPSTETSPTNGAPELSQTAPPDPPIPPVRQRQPDEDEPDLLDLMSD